MVAADKARDTKYQSSKVDRKPLVHVSVRLLARNTLAYCLLSHHSIVAEATEVCLRQHGRQVRLVIFGSSLVEAKQFRRRLSRWESCNGPIRDGADGLVLAQATDDRHWPVRYVRNHADCRGVRRTGRS